MHLGPNSRASFAYHPIKWCLNSVTDDGVDAELSVHLVVSEQGNIFCFSCMITIAASLLKLHLLVCN